MTSGDQLYVTIAGRDLGLRDLLLRIDAEMQVSANKAVQLGQSYARLAQAQQAPALASQVLAGTLTRAGGASERALIGIETQAARLESGGAIAAFGRSASSSLLSIVGPAAAATAGLRLLQGVVSEAEAGFALRATLDANTKAIQIQLAGLRDSNVAFQQAAQYAAQYKLTQQETTEAIGAAIPVIRNSKASMDTILGTFDQLRVRSPEKTFQDAARALGELQAGQYTSLNKIFNIPLEDARKLSEEIKKGGDAVQLVSQYLTSVGAGMDVVAARATGAAGAMKDLAVTSEQLKLALGDDATGPGLLILQTRIRATQGLINLLRGDTASMAQGFRDATAASQGQAAAQQAYLGAILQGKGTTEAYAAATAAATATVQAYTNAAIDGGGGTFYFTDAIRQSTGAFDEQRTAIGNAQILAQQATAAQLGYADAMAQSGIQARAAAQAAELKGNADQVAAVDAQTHAVAQNQLAVQAQNAAKALLAAGASGASTAAVLAGSSGQVDVLTAAYYRLYAAQQLVGAGATQQQAADFRSMELFGQTSAQRNAQLDKERAADAARSRQLIETGTQQQKTNELERQYGEAVRQSGAGSAAAIDAQTKLLQARQSAAKAAGGGGGAGGVKLSDQQKLQNQLLASQEQYDTRAEDAELQHQRRLLDIQADYQKRMKAAQDAFGQSQLEGRAGFYDSLGSIEDAGLRQALSAQYEAAFAEADRIAAEKGADVGQKFLEAKQSAIEAQGRRASEIAQATKEGDKDKAEYLAGVDRLYREAEDRKLKSIAEGNDSLAAQRDAQIADEATSYDAAQEKIVTSADRAAAAKIAASERAGKKIDEEGLKVDVLTGKYDALGAAGSRAGITPAQTATGTPPTQQQPAQQATVTSAGPSLADLITSLMSKLDDVKGAIVDAEKSGADQVAGAVKNLRGVVS